MIDKIHRNGKGHESGDLVEVAFPSRLYARSMLNSREFRYFIYLRVQCAYEVATRTVMG